MRSPLSSDNTGKWNPSLYRSRRPIWSSANSPRTANSIRTAVFWQLRELFVTLSSYLKLCRNGISLELTCHSPRLKLFSQLSDSTGTGTGGTSVPISVGSSGNSSCLSTSPSPSFSFQIIPNNAINQCQPTTLAWDNSTQGYADHYINYTVTLTVCTVTSVFFSSSPVDNRPN